MKYWGAPVVLLPLIVLPLFYFAPDDSRALPLGVLVYAGAVCIWALARRLEYAQLKNVSLGILSGVGVAFLSTPLIRTVADSDAGRSVLTFSLYLIVSIIGIALALEKSAPEGVGATPPTEEKSPSFLKICDTSVLIDGRLADMAQAGFVDGELVIPQFILRELQGIADSSEQLKRNRGRRGLDIVKRLQEIDGIKVSIPAKDYPEEKEVDHKLMLLAADINASLITNDFNLNKLARVRSIKVLNLNDLVNALKTIFLPGEEIVITVSRAGKEHGQGIAYLDDGTMVVVDSGAAYVGQHVKVIVTNIHQTTAGRMIFSRFEDTVSKKGGQDEKPI